MSCLLNVIVSYHRSLFERYRCICIYPSEVDSNERELILAHLFVRSDGSWFLLNLDCILILKNILQ